MENKLFTIVNKEDEASFLTDLKANTDNFKKKLVFVFGNSENYIVVNGEKFLPTPPDPYNGHEYVEIGGLKWATMNIGATSPEQAGLYFAWGETQGYTAEQVGSGEGQKYFGWEDYKYGNGTSSPGATGMTKYNSTDGLTTLDAVDDAAVANWGGSWRMPTTADFQALGAAVNTAWTQVNNVYGILCTDKTDSSKTLFFPAVGACNNGSAKSVGNTGYYLSSSLSTRGKLDAGYLLFRSNNTTWNNTGYRYYGRVVRPVIG